MSGHESAIAQNIAYSGELLRVQVGSGLHGTNVEDQDDRDEMGVCVEPPDCVVGLNKFEQYQFRTQPEGARSGPGDLDLTIYSLRKWTRLAAAGNPTVLMLMFAPESEWCVVRNPYAQELQVMAPYFASKQAGARFLGYLQSQKARILGLTSRRTNRPELVDKYGFDTKFAYHAVRLGWQGIEYMDTGRITLPMRKHDREYLVAMRTGALTRDEVLATINETEAALIDAIERSRLPESPNREVINSWLFSTYQRVWNEE